MSDRAKELRQDNADLKKAVVEVTRAMRIGASEIYRLHGEGENEVAEALRLEYSDLKNAIHAVAQKFSAAANEIERLEALCEQQDREVKLSKRELDVEKAEKRRLHDELAVRDAKAK